MKVLKGTASTVLFIMIMAVSFFAFQSDAFAAAIVGKQLKTPEAGWRRYDDSYKMIRYLGSNWGSRSNSNDYNSTDHFTANPNSTAAISFYGTKFRLIGYLDSNRPTVVTVKIDDKTYTYNPYKSSVQSQTLLFESPTLSEGTHNVVIGSSKAVLSPWKGWDIDAIDINSSGYLIDAAPGVPNSLSAMASVYQIELEWEAVSNATYYNVKRAIQAGGPYETIATSVTEVTYNDAIVSDGIEYYYVVTAVNTVGESVHSNEASATLTKISNPVLDVTINEEKVSVGQEFVSDISLKNVNDIYAEDFKISYDTDLLEYLGYEEVIGYKMYNTPADENGMLRFIVASQGEEYGINEDTVILKLHFRAKAVGTAKVDALKGRIADVEKEFDLEEENCLEDTVIIEQTDVNKSGEYTLLDLAIDARYYGYLASTVDPVLYSAQQAGDEYVNDDDLLYIVNQMLSNSNYLPNQ